jgi:hypothetical protein
VPWLGAISGENAQRSTPNVAQGQGRAALFPNQLLNQVCVTSNLCVTEKPWPTISMLARHSGQAI